MYILDYSYLSNTKILISTLYIIGKGQLLFRKDFQLEP